MRSPMTFVGVLSALGAGCGAFAPNEEPGPSEASTARPIPIASTALASSTHEQALRALASDAWRREARFMDAADPGFAFRSTRVTAGDLDEGRFEPEELYQIGAALFSFTFTPEIGFGAADLPAFSRFHREQRGGPDANRCADCHWRGGIAGAGDAADNAFFRGDGVTEASSLVRNPPSLVGAGWRELLAAQMSADLQAQRDELAKFARQAGYGVQVELASQGVSCGVLSAEADGSIDAGGLEGIDADLVVKPFGWKGTFSTLRDVVEDALMVHHGMQSTHVVRNEPTEKIGDGPADDPDGDGVVDDDDRLAWAEAFGQAAEGVSGPLMADGNNDGVVDAADYTIWRDNLGARWDDAVALLAQAVPEPASWLLLAVIAFASPRRRDRVRRPTASAYSPNSSM